MARQKKLKPLDAYLRPGAKSSTDDQGRAVAAMLMGMEKGGADVTVQRL